MTYHAQASDGPAVSSQVVNRPGVPFMFDGDQWYHAGACAEYGAFFLNGTSGLKTFGDPRGEPGPIAHVARGAVIW